MSNFHQIGAAPTGIQRAHLAVVEGGAGAHSSAPAAAMSRTGSISPETRFSRAAAGAEPTRSRHESGVRAVAQQFDSFEDALLPMVLASGVSGEAAATVAEAIQNNPALKAQAERAFQRARMNAV